MFRTLICPSSGACDYSVELRHWSYCSWFDVCWSFGVVGLEWYPCCRLIRSLQLFCWITTLVVLFLVRCVLEFQCGWVGVVSVLQAEACNTDTTLTQPHRISNTHQTKNNTTNVVIQQNSRKLLMMDILRSETCWVHKKWNKIASWYFLRNCYAWYFGSFARGLKPELLYWSATGRLLIQCCVWYRLRMCGGWY